MSIIIQKLEGQFSIGFFQSYANTMVWIELVRVEKPLEAIACMHYINGGALEPPHPWLKP
jgi:hypothetical protein